MSKPLLVATIACLACLVHPLAGARADDATLGKQVDDFSLRDFHGNEHALGQYGEKRVVVIAFFGTQCPLAKVYAPRLADLSREFADRGVQFLGDRCQYE